ncbi:MAG TPA: sugar phosphate nucleotidyltransferase, partial [Polyangiaceae bacterium]|nr:sugar phosphate nucleotidyltransferase [Polyangiaceae bacterium]
MKGVILAGGLGTRLSPLTDGVNKHLLPVGARPMIHYPLQRLCEAGLKDVVIVSSAPGVAAISAALGSGGSFGAQICYCVQDEPRGIADALAQAARAVGREALCVILGDNVFDAPLREYVDAHHSDGGALLLLREVPDPERYGVARLDGGRVAEVVEKPTTDVGNMAVTGIYMYDAGLSEHLRGLRPSPRGELEITDVNNAYLQHGALRWRLLGGRWIDAGTLEAYREANTLFSS